MNESEEQQKIARSQSVECAAANNMVLFPNVMELNELDIRDGVPSIQSASSSVEVDITPLQNPLAFADHPAFGAQFSDGNIKLHTVHYFMSHVCILHH